MIDPRMDEPDPPNPEDRRVVAAAYAIAILAAALIAWLAGWVAKGD